jgi:oxygen-dependent protoporphyrinogen oxidase
MSTIVVGGGISGLTVAYGIRQRGEDVTVLEQADRCGGAVHSVLEQGFLTEDGPNTLLDRHPEVRALLKDLDLESQISPAAPESRKRWIYSRGKLRPVSPPALLASNLLSGKGRLRLLAEPFTRRSSEPDESLGSFARRHVGNEATEVLVDAVQGGIFAGDLERLSAASAFPTMVALEKKHRSLLFGAIREGVGKPSATLSLRGGLSTLIQRLEDALNGAIRLNASIASLQHASRWRISLGPSETLEADRLVLAIPAYAAARLLRDVSRPLSDALGEIRYAPVAVVHLGYRRDALAIPSGFGFLVPGSEGQKLLGAIFTSALFPDRAPADQILITCVMGGMRSPEVAGMSATELTQLASETLGRMLGGRSAPTYQRVVKWAQGIPQYEVGHSERLGRIQTLLSNTPGLHLAGNAYLGTGLADSIRDSRRLVEGVGFARG